MRRSLPVSIATALTALLLSGAPARAADSPGDPDRGFGSDGIAARDLGGSDVATSVLTLTRRRTLVAVNSSGGGDERVTVLRLDEDGKLDRFYGRDGLRRIGPAGGARGASVVPARDGGIFVGFSVDGDPGTGFDFAIAKLNASGDFDREFAPGGFRRISFGPGIDRAADLVSLRGGGVAQVGTTTETAELTDDSDLAIAVLGADGELDDGFAGDGTETFDLADDERAVDVAEDGDGRILLGADVNTGGGDTSRLGLVRVGRDGAPDPSLGGDGVLISDAVGGVRDVGLARLGRIVALGSLDDEVALARFTPNGDLDPEFAGDGRLQIGRLGPAAGVALAIRGARITVGAQLFDRRGDFAGAAGVRLRTNGSLNADWGDGGTRRVAFGARGELRSVDVGSGGLAVFGGAIRRADRGDVALARLLGAGR